MKNLISIILILGIFSVSCTKDNVDQNISDSFFITLNGIFRTNNYSAINTLDNNIAVCGNFEDEGENYYNILKLTENGEVLWKKQSGYSIFSLVQNRNSDFFICGAKRTNPNEPTPEYNTVLIKTDSDGDTLWTKIFDLDYSSRGEIILETKDENILIAGNTLIFGYGPGKGALLTKTDYNGNLLWSRLYDNLNDFHLDHILETKNGDLFLTGTSKDKYSMHLLKLDANGDKLWDKKFNSDTLKFGHCAVELPDSQLMVCGQIEINDSTWKVYVLKMDSDGNSIWEKEYGTNGAMSNGVSIKQNTDETIVITGSSYRENNSEVILLKIDQDGNQILFNKYESQYSDHAINLINNISDGYIITGSRRLGEIEGSILFITKLFEENDK